MILKKVEKGDEVKAIYKSSNVLASKYNKKTSELTVTFNRGSVYTYAGVPAKDYTRFEIAESQGKILNSTIKKYEFTKGEDIDPAKIIQEVEKHQEEELKGIEESIIKVMDATIKGYAKNEKMDMSMLTKVQHFISKYQYEKNV
jgi:hypothetical protein